VKNKEAERVEYRRFGSAIAARIGIGGRLKRAAASAACEMVIQAVSGSAAAL